MAFNASEAWRQDEIFGPNFLSMHINPSHNNNNKNISPYEQGKRRRKSKFSRNEKLRKVDSGTPSSFASAIKLYTASTEQLEAVKNASKKLKKSVLTLPNDPTPIKNHTAVSDMTESDYFEFDDFKQYKRLRRTSKKARCRKKALEVDIGDKKVQSSMNVTDYYCSSTNVLKQQCAEINGTYSPEALDKSVKSATANDVWVVLRSINKFQFRPPTNVTETNNVKVPKKRKNIAPKVLNSVSSDASNNFKIGRKVSSSLSAGTSLDCLSVVTGINLYRNGKGPKVTKREENNALNENEKESPGNFKDRKVEHYGRGRPFQTYATLNDKKGSNYRNTTKIADVQSNKSKNNIIQSRIIDRNMSKPKNQGAPTKFFDSTNKNLQLRNWIFDDVPERETLDSQASYADIIDRKQMDWNKDDTIKILKTLRFPIIISNIESHSVNLLQDFYIINNSNEPRYIWPYMVEWYKQMGRTDYILNSDSSDCVLRSHASNSISRSEISNRDKTKLRKKENDISQKPREDKPIENKLYENAKLSHIPRRVNTKPRTKVTTGKKNQVVTTEKEYTVTTSTTKTIVDPDCCDINVEEHNREVSQNFGFSSQKSVSQIHQHTANEDFSIMSYPPFVMKEITNNLKRFDKTANKKNHHRSVKEHSIAENDNDNVVQKFSSAARKLNKKVIEDVIRKISNGIYYFNNNSIENSTQTEWSDADLEFSLSDDILTNDPFENIAGFDDVVLGTEIKSINHDEITVQNSQHKIIFKFDIMEPSNLNIENTVLFIPLYVTDSDTKVYKSNISVSNNILPATLCTLIPLFMKNIGLYDKDPGDVNQKNALLNCEINNMDVTLLGPNCKDSYLSETMMVITNQTAMILKELFHKPHFKFSGSIKTSLSESGLKQELHRPRNIRGIKFLGTENNLLPSLANTEMMLDAVNILYLKYKNNNHPTTSSRIKGLSYIKTAETNINIIKPKSVHATVYNETHEIHTAKPCTALIPYVTPVKSLDYIVRIDCEIKNETSLYKFSLTPSVMGYLYNLFSMFTSNIKNSCYSLLRKTSDPAKLRCANTRLQIDYCTPLLNIESASVNDYKMHSGFEVTRNIPANVSEETLLSKYSKNCRYKIYRMTNKNQIVDRKYRTSANNLCKSKTAIDSIKDMSSFFDALGANSSRLCNVLNGSIRSRLFRYISQIKIWVKFITPRQAILLLLLSNKTETPNLKKMVPVILQAIAVNRITNSSELNLEIEVIEREYTKTNKNLQAKQCEGISYISASKENRDKVLIELLWIAKTTASDHNREFTEANKQLIKSMLKSRTTLNPSYLRLMARYIGLGLLKTVSKNSQ